VYIQLQTALTLPNPSIVVQVFNLHVQAGKPAPQGRNRAPLFRKQTGGIEGSIPPVDTFEDEV